MFSDVESIAQDTWQVWRFARIDRCLPGGGQPGRDLDGKRRSRVVSHARKTVIQSAQLDLRSGLEPPVRLNGRKRLVDLAARQRARGENGASAVFDSTRAQYALVVHLFPAALSTLGFLRNRCPLGSNRHDVADDLEDQPDRRHPVSSLPALDKFCRAAQFSVMASESSAALIERPVVSARLTRNKESHDSLFLVDRA